MLSERVFLLGGAVTLTLGLVLAATGVLVVPVGTDPSFFASGCLTLGFGAFFLYVGLGARRERLALLRLGEETHHA